MHFRKVCISGVWVFVTLLPTLMLNNSKRDVAIDTRDYIGWAMWAVGMFFEVVADAQKSIFRANPNNEVRKKIPLTFF